MPSTEHLKIEANLNVVSFDEIYNIQTPGKYKVSGLSQTTVVEKIESLEELKERGIDMMEKEEKEVATNLQEILGEKGLFVSDLAKLTGYSRQLINAVILEKWPPGIDFALKVSYVLGLPVEKIFHLTPRAWMRPCLTHSGTSMYVDTLHLLLMDYRLMRWLVKTNRFEYYNKTTREMMTKKEYQEALRKHIQDHKEEKEKELRLRYPKKSGHRIQSLAIQALTSDLHDKIAPLYQKLGEKIEPYVIK